MGSPLFLVVLVIVLGPVHFYLWLRLIRDPIPAGRRRVAATVILGFLGASLLVGFSRRVRDLLPDIELRLVGYLWIVVMLYLLISLLVLEIPRRVALRKARDPQTGEIDESRRKLITRSTAIVAGLTAASITGYGVRTALGPPVLKRLQVPLAKLPRGLDGYRIAVVSDIHIGRYTDAGHTHRIVDAINSLDADVIAMVGDLADGDVGELRGLAAPLRDLTSRDGTFFVTGNHEYFGDVDGWLAEVSRLGMRPLRNERLEIRGLDLAGIDDVTASPDFERALGDRDPAKPVVLLAHQPVAVFEAAKYQVDLQLSGHTHGGQIFPFGLFVRTQQPVLSGLAEIDGTKIYVTNGAGFWGPPARVGAPPDVTLVELRNA